MTRFELRAVGDAQRDPNSACDDPLHSSDPLEVLDYPPDPRPRSVGSPKRAFAIYTPPEFTSFDPRWLPFSCAILLEYFLLAFIIYALTDGFAHEAESCRSRRRLCAAWRGAT